MLVSQISKPGVQTYQNNSRTEPFEADKVYSISKKPSRGSGSGTVHLETARAAAHIASKYQLRSSTAGEMAKMGRELFNADIITLDEYHALSYRREFHFDYMNISDKYPDIQVEPPPKRDFIKIWQENLIAEKESNDIKGIERAGRIVNILENLHSVAGGAIN